MTAKQFIPVGDHPNEIALTRDGKRLFVANANFNTVSVIGLDAHESYRDNLDIGLARRTEWQQPNSLAAFSR